MIKINEKEMYEFLKKQEDQKILNRIVLHCLWKLTKNPWWIELLKESEAEVELVLVKPK